MTPPSAWADLPFFRESWPALAARLAAEPDWLPGPAYVFAALELTPPESVRCIILGQDPYPTPGHAHGLAFSVTPQTPLPRSLRNIYTELRDDLGACPANGDLRGWAQQGVLLLNTALSVAPGKAGAHARWGWDRLAREVVVRAQSLGPQAFMVWGQHAAKIIDPLARPQDLALRSPHPSPLSARRGFFGSRPFSKVNAWLEARGEAPIDWTLSPAARGG